MEDGKDAEALVVEFQHLRTQIMDDDSLSLKEKAAKLFLLAHYHTGSRDQGKFDERSGLEVSNAMDSTKEAIIHGTFGVRVNEFADQERVTITPLDPEKIVLDGQQGSFGTDYFLRDDVYEHYLSLKEEIVEHEASQY